MENFHKIWKIRCSQYNIKKQPDILPAVRRIVVLGDIHGDLEVVIKLLKIAKVIDDCINWIGEDTVIVQVGDQIDRCRYNGVPCDQINYNEGNDLKILYFFTKLHKKASKCGGAVYSLMGNHELMNVLGDMRYVSLDGLNEFKSFTDYNSNVKIEEYTRKQAFKPGNMVSNFLACTRKAALIIGSNLFVHAGILPDIARKYNITKLNNILSLYLWNMIHENEYNDILFDPNSPFWTRKYKSNVTPIECKELLSLNDIYKVGKIYVGHTPNINQGISSICDNKIWLTDYGVSKAFKKYREWKDNEIHVLEILNDGATINILYNDNIINIINNNIKNNNIKNAENLQFN